MKALSFKILMDICFACCGREWQNECWSRHLCMRFTGLRGQAGSSTGRKEITVQKTWEAVVKQVSQVAMRDWVQGEEQNGETAW
jgi:hypothetical protein